MNFINVRPQSPISDLRNPMNPIEIRPPVSLHEYDQACALVEQVYYEHGITSQPAVRHPKAVFVAVRDGEVLGSVGFRSGDQGPLPVEYYYGFDVDVACARPRDTVFEIVKLAARERAEHTVFRGLVAACAQYGFVERSFGLGFAILKPQLEKALNRFLRVPTHPLPHACIEARARADYPRYFFEGLPPRPVAFRSEERIDYLARMFSDLAGKATLHCADFDHRRDYSVAGSYAGRAGAALAA
jgi:hypothetical protein